MARYVRTAVNVPSLTGVFVERERSGEPPGRLTFDYDVPAALHDANLVGHLVLVPFGSRTLQAVVLQDVETAAVAKTRSILQLVDPEPVMTLSQIALAEWMSARTLAPISSMIGLFLPPGLAQQADTLFKLRAETPGSAEGSLEKRIIAALRSRGPLRGRQIDRLLPGLDWRRVARSLQRRGFLDAELGASARSRAPEVRSDRRARASAWGRTVCAGHPGCHAGHTGAPRQSPGIPH